MRGRRSDRRGQALVEFALTLPLLMLLLMGIVEIGRAWNMKQTLTDAAREGARLAVVADPLLPTVAKTDTAVKLRVQGYVRTAGMDSTRVRVSYPAGLKTGTGQVTAVRVAYPFRFVTLQRLASVVQLDSLRTTVRMRNE